MESALAGVDLGRYRRIVQMFWDPEPTNDQSSDAPVWCLGNKYQLGDREKLVQDKTGPAQRWDIGAPTDAQTASISSLELPPVVTNRAPQPVSVPGAEAPPDSASSRFPTSLADEGSGPTDTGGWPGPFLDDFDSRFWMTYRSEFEPIPKSADPRAVSALSLSMRIKSQLGDQGGFSSDTGWGCMIRSGQMLLANTMSMLNLGRDWRRGEAMDEEKFLLSRFADDIRAPYSLHQFVQYGAVACGKYPGEWFGPSATARCIRALVDRNESQLRVYFTGDGPDVYEDRFMDVAKPQGHTFSPTLILVGTRLGIDKITPVYWEALIAALQLPQSVGIAGGRPSSSHYFVGAQSPFLFYLDPHHTRPALPYYEDPRRYVAEDVDSVHTRRLRRLHLREMDPSMLLGFLIRDEDDWEDWKKAVKHVQGKAVVHVTDVDPLGARGIADRRNVIDEVESLSEDDEGTIPEA